MARQRGGQQKHWAEIARIQMWYEQVKHRGWSDYRLNQEFAWSDTIQPQDRERNERPRTFEWIRKKARAPKGRDSRWRGMADLVAAVDRHPEFETTKAIYEAEMWTVFQENNPTADTVQDRIDRILSSYGLVRLPMDEIASDGKSLDKDSLIVRIGERQFYEGCMRIAMARLNRFDQITLCWSLYLQTEPAHCSMMREVLLEILDGLLDVFCNEFLQNHYDFYYERTLDAILTTRLNLEPAPATAYRHLEKVGECAVIPVELAGVITLEHLLSELWTAATP